MLIRRPFQRKMKILEFGYILTDGACIHEVSTYLIIYLPTSNHPVHKTSVFLLYEQDESGFRGFNDDDISQAEHDADEWYELIKSAGLGTSITKVIR